MRWGPHRFWSAMMCGNRLQSPIMCIFSPTAASTPKARQTSSALQPMPLCASFSTLRPMAPLLFITQPRRSKPILVYLARRAGKDDADLIQFLQHCRARRFEQPGPRRLRRALFPAACAGNFPRFQTSKAADPADSLYWELVAVDYCGVRPVRRFRTRLARLLHFESLWRSGSARIAGCLIAHARTWPGGHGAAVRGPRWHFIDSRDWPDESRRAIDGDGNDGDSARFCDHCAAFLGGRDCDAIAGRNLQRGRRDRRLSGGRTVDWRGRGRVLVADARRRRCVARYWQRRR